MAGADVSGQFSQIWSDVIRCNADDGVAGAWFIYRPVSPLGASMIVCT